MLKDHSSMNAYRLVRIILIFLPIVSLSFFWYAYVNPTGVLDIEYDFCQNETPYMSGLSPHGRVLELDQERCKQEMVIDPVYFDIRLPQSYEHVTINLDYGADKDDQVLDIGVGRNPGAWDWIFNREKKLLSEYPLSYHTTLDLSQAQFDNNRYRFIISAPGLDTSVEKFTFYYMNFRFEKQPLTQENFWFRVKNMLHL